MQTHAALFQVKMNGPEAVKILRNSLKFRHTIIGEQCESTIPFTMLCTYL
jgi:hypothetical protein